MKQLAALLFVFPLAPIRADNPPKPVQKEMRSEKADLSYLLYLPPGYEKSDKPFPLILYLHCSGGRGKDLNRIKGGGIPMNVERKPLPGFIVVSPQVSFFWAPSKLFKLLDEVTEKYRVDRDRIYMTGFSMGCTGTWLLAAEAPERFAAIAPVSGASPPASAEKLKGLPIWIFHGGKDTVISRKYADDMVKALKAVGNEPKLTVLPDLAHNSADVASQVYDNLELYKWFLAHKRRAK